MAPTARAPIGGTELAALPAAGTERVLLVDAPEALVGIKTYAPGEAFGNHFHEHYDEFFAVLEGSLTVWTGRAVPHVLTAGTSMLCERGRQHCIVNTGGMAARLLYVKTPSVADDTVWVDWSPAADPA